MSRHVKRERRVFVSQDGLKKVARKKQSTKTSNDKEQKRHAYNYTISSGMQIEKKSEKRKDFLAKGNSPIKT